MHPTYSPMNPTAGKFLKAAVLVIGVIYLAGCFTPLHIHFDSIRYYNIKDCLQYGCPPDSFAATDYLPYGYTALLMVLDKLHILHSWAIVFINCIYLFGGVYFIKKVFEQQVQPVLLVAITLFNWVLIKFALHPLSEMQYIFFSCASLYCFHNYLQQKSYMFLLVSFVFAGLTVLTRAVGIALMPALFLGVAWQYKDQLKRIIQKNKIALVIVALLAVALVFFARQLKLVDYTSLLKGPLQQGVGHFFATNLKNHFTELAEVFINMPSNKVLAHLPKAPGEAFFVLLGVACFIWFLVCLCSKKSTIPFYIRVYLVVYSFIILNWPYYDPRFWAPVLPLMVVVILQTPFNAKPLLKLFGRAYLAVYLALGIFAASYSLYIGMNKGRFAQYQAGGDYRNEYETHFFGKPQTDTATHVDHNVVDILNKYD